MAKYTGLTKKIQEKVKPQPAAPTPFNIPAAPSTPNIQGAAPPAPTPKTLNIPQAPAAGQPIDTGYWRTSQMTGTQVGTKSGWVKTPVGWMPAGQTPSGKLPPGQIAPQFQQPVQQAIGAEGAKFTEAIAQIQSTPTTQEAEKAALLSPLEAGQLGAKIATGAGVGFAAGGPVGAIVGGAAGITWGIATIGSNKVQNVKVADTNRKLAVNNIKQITNLAEQGKIDAVTAAALLRQQEITLRQVEAVLHRENKGLVGADLSKGLDEEAKIRNYFEFESGVYKTNLINALADPQGRTYTLDNMNVEEVQQ